MIKIYTELVKRYFTIKYKELFLLLILILIGTAVGAVTPLLFGNIIDLILQKQIYNIIQNIAMFFLLSLLEIILGVVEAYLGNRVVLEISNEIKKDLNKKIMNMQMSQIDRYAKGELVNRIEGDPEEVVNTYINFFTGGIQVVANIIISIYFAITFSVVLTGIAIMFIGFSYVGTILYKKQYQNAKENLKECSDAYYAEIAEDFRNLEGIKSFNLQQTIIKRLEETYNKNLRLSKRMFLIEGKITATKSIGNTIYETVLLLGASILIIQGKLSIGNLVSFNQYISNVFQASSQLISYIMGMISCEVNIKRINEIMEGPQENLLVKKNIAGTIKKLNIDHVDFKYGSINVLKNINIDINSNGLYSIIGMNGAGKTTLLKLLLKLYEPAKGNIYINGINSNELSLKSIRNEISYIPKIPFLFNESIEYNLTLGKAIEHSILDEVCKKVGLDLFVKSRDHGYETKIGDDGYSLSSGTKQKISIARAILKNSSFWVCDEITSDLDGKTEAEIISLLHDIAKSKIIIMVSHDLLSIKNSKKIFVLHDKSIICSGDDATLRENNSIFRGLFYNRKDGL